MNLQTMLDQRNMTKYRLSQISGVPKTTVIDICSGKRRFDEVGFQSGLYGRETDEPELSGVRIAPVSAKISAGYASLMEDC